MQVRMAMSEVYAHLEGIVGEGQKLVDAATSDPERRKENKVGRPLDARLLAAQNVQRSLAPAGSTERSSCPELQPSPHCSHATC